ncbi:hypothetical protein TNCV_2896831 [Trichonephila clavipes]|nr:hypothetical protein TNCV_2896831 [Trichonephila clavipes]
MEREKKLFPHQRKKIVSLSRAVTALIVDCSAGEAPPPRLDVTHDNAFYRSLKSWNQWANGSHSYGDCALALCCANTCEKETNYAGRVFVTAVFFTVSEKALTTI